MTIPEKPYLTTLNSLLGERTKTLVYPCIEDLLEHGLDLSRFSAGEYPPHSQDVMRHLGTWSRHAGLDHEQTSAWLIEYCITVLVRISKRTPAAIRHSTKGMLKYVFKDAVPFQCDCEKNKLRAHCSTECPVYAEMLARYQQRLIDAAKPYVRPPPPAIEYVSPVKQRFAEQFRKAMAVAIEAEARGMRLNRIVTLLNESGWKTRTGRAWRCATLSKELDKWKATPEAEKVASPTSRPADSAGTSPETRPEGVLSGVPTDKPLPPG